MLLLDMISKSDMTRCNTLYVPFFHRCDNPVASNPRAKKMKIENDEDLDDATKEFHQRNLLSGRSMIFM